MRQTCCESGAQEVIPVQKLTAAALLLPLLGVAAPRQDRLPHDEARGYAKACAEQAATFLPDAQIKMDVDAEKPCAVRGEGGGAMVIPDKNLSPETLHQAGKDVSPVGQLWFRKWTVVADGKATPNDKLRIVTVNLDNQDRPMPLFLLGVRQAKSLELVIYAKDSAPLLVLPLTKLETVQERPVALDWRRGDKGKDALVLSLLGKYQAELTIASQEK